MLYQNDSWLAERLGKNVFNLVTDDRDTIDEAEGEKPISPALIYSKVSSHRTALVSNMIKKNFHIIDINVLLHTPISSLVNKKSDILNVRHATIDDQEALTSIAYEGFTLDRFHTDPQISNQHASQIKADWDMNYILGKRGDLTLVIEDENNNVQGFLLLIHKENRDTIIDLIAMNPAYRGQGAGTIIISAIHEFLPKTRQVFVGTQLSNYGSINFYSKLGFKIDSTTFMLHRHI
jgi:ribosomal protein S18 acetylase RimI-like enzyme